MSKDRSSELNKHHSDGEPAQSVDESAIRTAVAQYNAAWNCHDAKVMARIFAEDADFVGGSGGRMDRAAFAKVVAQEHATVFKNYQLTIAVGQIRFLKQDIAIVDGSYKAAETGTGESKPSNGLFTLVMRKTGGTWLGVAMRSISQ